MRCMSRGRCGWRGAVIGLYSVTQSLIAREAGAGPKTGYVIARVILKEKTDFRRSLFDE